MAIQIKICDLLYSDNTQSSPSWHQHHFLIKENPLELFGVIISWITVRRMDFIFFSRRRYRFGNSWFTRSIIYPLLFWSWFGTKYRWHIFLRIAALLNMFPFQIWHGLSPINIALSSRRYFSSFDFNIFWWYSFYNLCSLHRIRVNVRPLLHMIL